MAGIEAFEAALKDVVKAKRLSQSKMDTLTQTAMKNIENDTQLVSTLYRTHKGLQSSGKVWSLYAFDALARAARHQVNKHSLVADVNAEKGNCATFLLKMEGILDSLFQDLVTSGSPELKEKAKKILDIWTKSNTFPSAVLSRLFALLKQGEKKKEPDKADPSANRPLSEPNVPAPFVHPPAQPVVNVPGTTDVQATLLALLSQAANAVNGTPNSLGQTAPNTASAPSAPAPVLDANQLALLQQLAQTAQRTPPQSLPVAAPPVPPLTTSHAVPVVPPVHGPSQAQSMPYRDDYHGPPSAHAPGRESNGQIPQQQQYAGRYNGPPDRGYRGDDYDYQMPHEYDRHDPRRGGASNSRGGFRDRGGFARGHGRGRWEDRGGDRNQNDRYRDSRSRDVNHNGGSYDAPNVRRGNRSRSPPGRFQGEGVGAGRGARPYSPPRRPAFRDGHEPQQGARDHRHGYGPGRDANVAAGFDEFGRELRTGSPGSDAASATGQRPSRPRSDSPLPPRSTSVMTSDRGSSAPESGMQAYTHAQSYQGHEENAYTNGGYAPGPSSAEAPIISPSTSTSAHGQPGVGLEAFDRASFDPSQPASWDVLGKAWVATHGSMPSQEELMQFVFGNMPLPVQTSSSGSDGGAGQGQYGYDGGAPGSPQEQRQQSFGEGQGRGQWRGQERQWDSNRGYGQGQGQQQRGGWRGRGGGGDGGGRGYGRGRGGGGGDYGRGGFGRGGYVPNGPRRGRHEQGGYGRGEYGNHRGGYGAGGRGYDDYRDTDAVTLVAGDGDDHAWQDQSQGQHAPPTQWDPAGAMLQDDMGHGEEGNGGGAGGRMQKVDDKWVFVRGTV